MGKVSKQSEAEACSPGVVTGREKEVEGEMIEPILKELEPLVVNELYRANLVNPQFHSSHEALGVIGEEVWECDSEHSDMIEIFECLVASVFDDKYIEAKRYSDTLRRHALDLAAEAIQVAAMCDKYILGKCHE